MKDALAAKKSQILKDIRAFCKEAPEVWGQSKKSLEIASLSILKDLHNQLQKPGKSEKGGEANPNAYTPNKTLITHALNRTLRLIEARTPRPFLLNTQEPKSEKESAKSQNKNKPKSRNPKNSPTQDSPY